MATQAHTHTPPFYVESTVGQHLNVLRGVDAGYGTDRVPYKVRRSSDGTLVSAHATDGEASRYMLKYAREVAARAWVDANPGATEHTAPSELRLDVWAELARRAGTYKQAGVYA